MCLKFAFLSLPGYFVNSIIYISLHLSLLLVHHHHLHGILSLRLLVRYTHQRHSSCCSSFPEMCARCPFPRPCFKTSSFFITNTNRPHFSVQIAECTSVKCQGRMWGCQRQSVDVSGGKKTDLFVIITEVEPEHEMQSGFGSSAT